MSNAEKYKEVFGLDVDREMCPTKECEFCPCRNTDGGLNLCGGTYAWWDSEYKESAK